MQDFMKLADEFAALVREQRRLKDLLRETNGKIAALEDEMLALHGVSGVGSSVRLASGGTLIISEKMAVEKSDDGAILAWLDANGMGDIARRNINAQTLAALCRERAERCEPMPDGVRIGSFKQITWRQ